MYLIDLCIYKSVTIILFISVALNKENNRAYKFTFIKIFFIIVHVPAFKKLKRYRQMNKYKATVQMMNES